MISTARDTHGRPTVVELVPARGLRLYPVGRLDADSSGLILLTNDGELANRLTHPRYRGPARPTGRASAAGRSASAGAARGAARRRASSTDGVHRAGARRAMRPRCARRRVGDREVIELTIREGRNRQVRRMCEAVGHPVLELQRIAFGPLRLGDLAPGEHRPAAARSAPARRRRGRPASEPARGRAAL